MKKLLKRLIITHLLYNKKGIFAIKTWGKEKNIFTKDLECYKIIKIQLMEANYEKYNTEKIYYSI